MVFDLKKLVHVFRFLTTHFLVVCVMAWIAKLFYVAYLHPAFLWDGISVWFQSIWYGLPMDLSLAGYALIPAFFMYIGVPFPAHKGWFLSFYSLLGLIMMVVNSIDVLLYSEWESRINSLAFFYTEFNQSPAQSVSFNEIVIFVVSCILSFTVFFVLLFYLVLWITRPNVTPTPNFTRKRALIFKLLLVPFVAALSLVLIRGGVGKSTINHSRVSFSEVNLNNQAAVNPLWNALFFTLQYQEQSELSSKLTQASDLIDLLPRDSLFMRADPIYPSLSSQIHPNILFVILEGFSSKMLEPHSFWYLNGISSLAEQGFKFSHLYASGTRTDIGLCALLTGTPSPSGLSYLSDPDRLNLLPRILKMHPLQDYTSRFLYGGDIHFANLKSLIKHIGFDSYKDQNDFELSLSKSGSWGLHDAYLYRELKQEIEASSSQTPWFISALTLSSHAPYDVPGSIKGEPKTHKIKRAYEYADSCLYDFVKWFSKHPAYDNTILIITSDHGRNLYLNNQSFLDPYKFHIPFVILGGALNPAYKAQSMNRIIGQTSVIPWLFANINRMDSASMPFKFYQDPNIDPNYAVYFHNNGVGVVTKDTFFNVYEEKKQHIKTSERRNWSDIVNIGLSYEHYVIKKYFGSD